MRLFNIIPKKKVKGIREWIAFKLVRLAKKIYPKSEEVKSFFTELMIDYFIKGEYVYKIDKENPKNRGSR